MHSLPGTYTLVLSSSVEKPVNIGKLGTLFLKPGFYVYIGSAFGPGGLKARIKHHFSYSTRPHWHLDYLRPALSVCEIWYTYDQTRREHQWAAIHSQTRGSILPLPGFGSSDCRCLSHLLFYKSKPSGNHFRRKIRAEFNDHARFMIEKSDKFLDNNLISDIH
jgi:Uri superfamily endonuclease